MISPEKSILTCVNKLTLNALLEIVLDNQTKENIMVCPFSQVLSRVPVFKRRICHVLLFS